MKVSPVFYMGNKKKLIKKGLIDLFPSNINTYVEPFGGSAIVGMNVTANNYKISDSDKNLVDLYRLFKYKTSSEIIQHIELRIEEYSLARERTKRNEFKDGEKLKQYKEAYMTFRSYYNSNKNVLDFYTLMFYSFSQQFRFNNSGNFNMPCGNDCFSDLNKSYIENGCVFFSNKSVEVCCQSFKEINMYDLTGNDFVYLDPPYLNTTATYNEKGGWTEENENDLYLLCEGLNDKGVKFGMSNVFENKGVVNEKLIKWCEENNWNVYTFDNFSYMACGKGNSNAKEVFICNY